MLKNGLKTECYVLRNTLFLQKDLESRAGVEFKNVDHEMNRYGRATICVRKRRDEFNM